MLKRTCIRRGSRSAASLLGGFSPNISLVSSGGHTLPQVDHPLDHTIIGSTQDDAGGECFDKCAKLLGLGYPGGPIIDRLATQGNLHFCPADVKSG